MSTTKNVVADLWSGGKGHLGDTTLLVGPRAL